MMNIYDVSKKAGVSIATVSRVLNGSPKVSEKTRQIVLKVMDELNYTPNFFARGLGLDSMKTIGILCVDSSDPYRANAVNYLEKYLRQNSYDSLLVCTGFAYEDKKSSLELLMSKRVDAIIMIGSNYVESDDAHNEYIRQAAEKIPVMILNGVLQAENVFSTVCDDYEAIYNITQKFIDGTRTKLLYAYNSRSYSGVKKLHGFLSALKNNGIDASEQNLVFIPYEIKSVLAIKNCLANLFGESEPFGFNGVITSDDILGISFIKYANDLNLQVPQELFVSGYNNFNLSECCTPELTSMDNRLDEICSTCVSSLMNIFKDEKVPSTITFSSKIIERGTTHFI